MKFLLVIILILLLFSCFEKALLHLFYWILLRKENKRREKIGQDVLKYDLPFDDDED